MEARRAIPNPHHHVWRIDTDCLRSFTVGAPNAPAALDAAQDRLREGERVKRVSYSGRARR